MYKINQTRCVKITTVEQKQHDCRKQGGKKRKKKKKIRQIKRYQIRHLKHLSSILNTNNNHESTNNIPITNYRY